MLTSHAEHQLYTEQFDRNLLAGVRGQVKTARSRAIIAISSGTGYPPPVSPADSPVALTPASPSNSCNIAAASGIGWLYRLGQRIGE